METITMNNGDTLTLNFFRADNQITTFLNGSQIYSRTTEGDPQLNEQISISQEDLKTNNNVLTIIGINWGASSHYKGDIQKEGRIISSWDNSGGGNGITWYQSYMINKN